MARLVELDRERMRWLSGQLCMLLAVSGAFTIDVGAATLATAVLLCGGVSLLFPSWITHIPSAFLRWSPFVLLAWIIGDFVRSGGDIIPPLYRMILWLLLYRALQQRNAPEERQMLLLSLFLILVTGVLTQDILFGVQMVMFGPMALITLVLTTLQPSSGDMRPVLKNFRWAGLPGRVWRQLDRRTALVFAALYLTLVAMTSLLFISLPRFDIGKSLPFPRLQSQRSLVGFSDTVQYGDLVDILDDAAIAMRVDVSADNPPAQPYWRMVALDAYVADGFRVSTRVLNRRIPKQGSVIYGSGIPATELSTPGIWTVYMEGGISAYLPMLGGFDVLRFNSRMSLDSMGLNSTLRLREVQASTLSMRYEGMVQQLIWPAVREDLALHGAVGISSETRSPAYLQEVEYPLTTLVVPDGDANERILSRHLARVGAKGEDDIESFAQRIIAHLQQGRGYSMQVVISSGEADTALRWLDSDLPGHCELYAGAFILLARAAEIPARMVTGFAGGDWNGYENYFMVRNRHAHAWAEIYDPARGWIRADPTPGSLRDRSLEEELSAGGLFADRTFRAYLDSLKVLWYRRVIQFDTTDQQELAEAVRGWSQSAGQALWSWIKALWNKPGDKSPDVTTEDVLSLSQENLYKRAIIWTMLVLLASAIAIAVHRSRSSPANLRQRAGALVHRARRRGIKLQERNEAWATDLLSVRYGPQHQWPADPASVVQRARRELRRVIRDQAPDSASRTSSPIASK